MNINPAQILQFIKFSRNPQQSIIQIVEQQAGGNPFFENLISLAKCNKGEEIETIARNMFKEKGLDFDKEFTSFKQSLGLK